MADTPIVSMKNLSSYYGKGKSRLRYLKNINLTIGEGEVLGLVGESGSGKSTLAKCLLGLVTDIEGELVVNAVRPQMVFQDPFGSLNPVKTVGWILEEPLRAMGIRDKAERRRRALEMLQRVSLSEEHYDRRPAQLSGGQRQRVAIGRAMVRDSKVFLMDEPLSNLDAKLRNQMRAEIILLRQKIDTTFIYVTHDQTEAMTLGDRIVIMKDGFIQQIGTPQEVFNHPHNLFVATFIGTPQMNLFENAKLIKQNGKYAVQLDALTVELSEEKQAKLAANNVEPQDIVLGVRPEHIELGSGIEGKVDVSEMMGSSVHLHVTSMGRDVVMVVSTMNMTGAEVAELAIGKGVSYGFAGHVCHVFSKETGINLEA